MAWARGVGVWYNSGIMAERMLTNEERVARANRVTWLSVWVNVALTAGKLVAGVVGHSAAMVADAAHSASDFATDFAVLLGMRLAGRPQDGDHPYGHGKYETVAAAVVGVSCLCRLIGRVLCVLSESIQELAFNRYQYFKTQKKGGNHALRKNQVGRSDCYKS